MNKLTHTLKAAAAAALIIVMGTADITAQNTVSPYSRFGYGLLGDNATSAQRQMGGVGYAMRSGRQINVMNPASYARIDSLTFLFDMGVDLAFIHSEQGTDKLNQNGGGLGYVTLQFPIGKRFGASVGLLPYSSVGYAFGSTIKNGSTAHEGVGGLNQAYAGFSGHIAGGLTAGFNFSYLFGNNTNDVYAYTSSGSTSVFEQLIEVRDWHVQFGLQYALPVGERRTLGFGLTYSPGKDLNGHASVVKYDASDLNNNISPDTVERIGLRHNFTLPDTWGAGINYQWGQRLLVEADFTYQPWSKAKFATMADFPATRFADRWKVAAGAQYRPRDRGNYLQSITYRAGAFFNRDYIMVGDNNVREWGVACGFGLPTLSTKTIINLGVEYRHRQAHPNPLLKERYVSITLGVNFNELWFNKRKID